MRKRVGQALQGAAIAAGVAGAVVGFPLTLPVVVVLFVPGSLLAHGETL